MSLKKTTHSTFVIISIITILVSVFCEKLYLIYVQPFTVVSIFIIYYTEQKGAKSFLYSVSQLLYSVGSVLLILGMRAHLVAISLVFSAFYLIFLRLMYRHNLTAKTSAITYVYMIVFCLPVVYIYYVVVKAIFPEIKHALLYFAILMFCMLSYVFTAIFYYLKDKSSRNLWMLIAAMNLSFMNILIALNELYMYETIFTVIVVICSLCFQWFVLKFMLHKEQTSSPSVAIDELA